MSDPGDSQADAHASSSLGRHGASDLYERITDQVIEMLDQGVVPWRSPILGRTRAQHPRNLNTGRPYRGINIFLLAFVAYMKGYESSAWLTFRQAKERGGNVKKGEKSSLVVFWKQYETKDKKTGEPIKVPLLRFYNLFNVAQTENIPAPDAPVFTPTPFNPIEAAEAIVKGYQDAPTIEYGGSQAFYRPSTDTIHMPEPTRFERNEDFYSTYFHEASHSVGHSKRLNRQLDTDPKPFGSPDYGKEELIAEMSAAFLCGHAGIYPVVVQNTASYISGWLGVLKKDKKLVIAAAGQAQRSADWILGVKPDVADPEQTAPAESQSAEPSKAEGANFFRFGA